MYDWVTHQAQHYLSNENVLVLMGRDFHYMNADMSFDSLDKMINFWNENHMAETNIEFIYSTPSMYVDAIAAENITWPTKYDDMFPYAD